MAIIVNDKCYLTFTIKDSHGRARYLAAYAARGRRGVNAKIKIIVSFTIKNENVICSAMPYGEQDEIIDLFNKMKETFSYPNALKLQFLDEEYHFRKNGDYMILIYIDSSFEDVDLNCSEEELRRKAILHSESGILRYHTSSSFVRNRYVSEYAKRRAHGVCQLCGKPAPFKGSNGEPFLETHHVIWLADGGDDSIDNTVALCPNCHKRMHVLNLSEDVEKLLRVAKMC